MGNSKLCHRGREKDLEKIYKIVSDSVNGNTKPIKENAPANWIENILYLLGATENQVKDRYLRCYVDYVTYCDGVLKIDTLEAWELCDFRDVLLEIVPNIHVYYLIEELGCGIYETNDIENVYFKERYIIDAFVDEVCYHDYIESKSEMIQYLSEISGIKITEIEDIDIDKWNEEQEDAGNYINFYELQYVF